MYRLWATSLFVVFWSVLQGAHGGTLRIGDPIVEDDQYVFPISLLEDAGEVAALDFRFQYDPGVFTPAGVTAGTAAVQASKQVLGRLRDPGEFGVLVMGLNDLGIDNGEVARISFERNNSAEATGTQLSVTNVTFSDGAGVEIPSVETTRSVALPNDEERTGARREGEERVSKEEEDASETPEVDAVGDVPGADETGTTAIIGDVGTGGDGFAPRDAQVDRRLSPGSVGEAISSRTAEAERIRNQIPTPVGRVDRDGAAVAVPQDGGSPAVKLTVAVAEPATQEHGVESVSTLDSVRDDGTIESNSNRASDSGRLAPARRDAERSGTDSAPSVSVLLGVGLAAIALVALFAARGKLFG